MPKSFTQREKIVSIVTVSVILGAVIFNILLIPALDKNDSLNREIKAAKLKLNKYVFLLSQKDRLQSKYASLPRGVDLTTEQGEGVTGALSQLEDFAKKSNIRLVDIRPQSSSRGSALGIKELVIDLRAEGNMEGYLKFIYNIESSLTLLKIKRLQLSSKVNSPLLDGSFSISQIILSD